MKNTAILVLVAFLNQLLIPAYALASEGKQTYSVAFLGKPTQRQSKAFKVLGKRIQTWMENGPYGRVQVGTAAASVAENELMVEKLRVQIGEFTRSLKKAVLESPDKSKGEKSIAEIKTLRKKMNLIGKFGPVLQKAYLAESAFYWKSERFQDSESALKKAIELDPNGKPVLEDWDMFASNFSVFAFEKELARVTQKMNQFCDTSISLKQKNLELRVNGFEIKDPKKSVKLAANAMHVISVTDSSGHSSESVLHCPKKSQKKLTVDLTKNGGFNTELSLSDTIKNTQSDGIIVADFKKEGVDLYFYSPKGGVTPIPLEKKMTEAELAEGSQDFSVPVSYSSMNRILSQHFGQNLMLAGSSKNGSLGSSLEEKFRKSGNKWYNNSILWGVVGGLVVGAAATYALTQQGEATVPKAAISMEVQ